MTSRPELTGSADLFYDASMARKYHTSSRMVGIQYEITKRAIELLCLPDPASDHGPSMVLDVGCGSGLSGSVLGRMGHAWVGCDVSGDMLNVANEQQAGDKEKGGDDGDDDEMGDASDDGSEVDGHDDDKSSAPSQDYRGDLIHHDMGTGLPFAPASFDACISISAIQWLCYSNSTAQNPKARLTRFFSSLYRVLRRGGRAVLQFYPETAEQAVLISECAASVGFAGGVVVDYPNSTKAKKHYLVLSFDRTRKTPEALDGMETGLHVTRKSSVKVYGA
eukprot:CAMPEP_0113314630 /NCGR_PEP_ID=MMETSP0010_2-20120614/10610_1 /TAXON_ID=216773 ORGANISM="Corethron hystrix, Strain 308" /NCGR_SAMPLE_ID=MMETSP0010_2 /ASSEMBLY_ACC=CAM_ASM_000155 /LENGTH=277 /DNA_ID=CAMNT_0000170947 /DNA_START=12 /DNA_END=841 /DNA_ORIENTATION=+ /assembly_acc=CAM_ASM_000155